MSTKTERCRSAFRIRESVCLRITSVCTDPEWYCYIEDAGIAGLCSHYRLHFPHMIATRLMDQGVYRVIVKNIPGGGISCGRFPLECDNRASRFWRRAIPGASRSTCLPRLPWSHPTGPKTAWRLRGALFSAFPVVAGCNVAHSWRYHLSANTGVSTQLFSLTAVEQEPYPLLKGFPRREIMNQNLSSR